MGFGIRFKTGRNLEELKEKKRRVVTSFPELMRACGREIAVSCGVSTVPYGAGDAARKKGENAVIGDISRVYASPARVAKSFTAAGKDAQGKAFLFALQNRQVAKAQSLVDTYCPPFRGVPIQPFDGGAAHKAARKQGRVPARQRSAMIVQTPRNLNAYINQEVSHVGEAKAGWAACALALGSYRGLPQWVTRHAGTLSQGSVGENYGANGVWKVVMVNLVRYASDALSGSEKQVAISIALQKFLKGQFTAIMNGASVPRR